MSVDREFLDLFWSISGENQTQADQAAQKLYDQLNKKTEDARKNYFAYTRERLIKGLKSFAEPARKGFSKTLLQFLTKFPHETTNSQLFQLLNKHIYQSSFSTKPEESAAKYAYLSILDILCQTNRLSELETEELNKVFQPVLALTQTTQWGPEALSILGVTAVKLSAKLARRLFADCIRDTWMSLNSSDTTFTGDQLLFLLRMQKKLPKFFRDTVQPIDITTKKFRKKFVSGVLSCSQRSAFALLDDAICHSHLASVWPALYEATTRASNSKRLTRLLQLTARVVCSHGDELTSTCLSKNLVELFATQLSYKKHACFSAASDLMSEMLKTVVQRWINSNKNHTDGIHDEPMETDQAEYQSCASPATLFGCLVLASHPIDFSSHHSAPKPCQFLLERTPKALKPQDMLTYAKQLMRLFMKPKVAHSRKSDEEPEAAPFQNADTIRSFVANQLQSVLQASLCHTDEVLTNLTEPVLDFLITNGLTSLVSVYPSSKSKAISSKSASACWISLFRFLNGMFPRSVRPDVKITQSVSNIPRMLRHLLHTACHQLESTKEIAKEQIPNEVLPHLRHSASGLKKLDSKDTLGLYMAQLHATACLFALSQLVGEWNQVATLLDDLSECNKRHAAQEKQSNADEPPWSAVLADVLLGLISYPSHMLRSIARLTFEALIISGKADTECLKLVADVIRTRLIKGVRSSETGEDNEEEAEEEEGSQLITFRNDFDSEQVAEEDAETEQPDEASVAEDANNAVDNESADTHSEDGDESATGENNEDDTSDDEDDSEDDEIDETKLQSIRESVRQALGPAALDEGELDSTAYREFTDEEMFARDAALVAAFRANRMTAPDRKAAERARSLGQMKMRCLDLLECIVQHSIQSELLLPAVDVLLEIGKLAAESEAKANRKHKTNEGHNRQRASFIARYGDLPVLHRILDTLKLLANRSPDAQRNLCTSLTSVTPLTDVMQSVINAAKLPHPSPLYTKCLCTVVQFLYRTAQLLGPDVDTSLVTLSAPLLDQLEIFVKCTRKSTIHRTVFISFLIQCPPFATEAAKMMFNSLKEFLEKSTGGVKPTSAEQFAAIQCFDLLAHVFKWIATDSDQSSAYSVRKLPEKVLAQLCTALGAPNALDTAEAVSNIPWLSSVAFAVAYFSLLQWTLKASQKLERPQIVSPELLNALRQLPSTSKPIRKAARRFVTFVEALSGKSDSPITREEKLRLKHERKKARQAKRREKALREQQRREALVTKNATTDSTARTPAPKKGVSSKSRMSDSVLLKTNPKPKDIKAVRPDKRKMAKKEKNEASYKKPKRVKIE